ncbi:MAG: hypothetical protein ACFFB3_20585 [Candidatus Hodarchaeota archaeon]
MPVETHQITLGIGVAVVLLASVLAILGLAGAFRLIPPLLVLVGAGFLGYSFYMGRDEWVRMTVNEFPDDQRESDLERNEGN